MYDGTITEVVNQHLLPVVSRFMTDYLVTEHEEGRIPAQCERIEHLAHAINHRQDGTGQEAAKTIYGGDGLALTVVNHKQRIKNVWSVSAPVMYPSAGSLSSYPKWNPKYK